MNSYESIIIINPNLTDEQIKRSWNKDFRFYKRKGRTSKSRRFREKEISLWSKRTQRGNILLIWI